MGNKKRGQEIIAIDGPAGSGKSTVARKVAEALDFLYIDTGAIYRALTLKAIREHIDMRSEKEIIDLSKNLDVRFEDEDGVYKVFLDRGDVTEAIRELSVSQKVKFVSGIKEVRDNMAALQRLLAFKSKGAVLEGRDIGTVVFPDADYKFYLDASPDERIKRRFKELKAKSMAVSGEEVARDVKERDHSDKTRNVAPLKKADDACYIDTTSMSIDRVVTTVLDTVRKKPKWFLKFLDSFIIKKWMLGYRISRLAFVVWLNVCHHFKLYGAENLPKKGPFIFASNHISLGDPTVLGVSNVTVPMSILAKEELFYDKHWWWWYYSCGCILLNRSKADIGGLKEALTSLKEGRALGIFPEGTRSRTGELQKPELGVGFLAMKSGAPVIPLFIHGTEKVVPIHGSYKIGLPVSAYIGKQVDFTGLDKIKDKKEKYQLASDRVMEAIARIKNQVTAGR